MVGVFFLFFFFLSFKHIGELGNHVRRAGGDAFQMDAGLCKYDKGKSFLPDGSSPSPFFVFLILLLRMNEYEDGRVYGNLLKASSKPPTLSCCPRVTTHPLPVTPPSPCMRKGALFLPHDLVTVGQKGTRCKKSWLLDCKTGEQRAAPLPLSPVYSWTQAPLSCPPQAKHCFIQRRDAEQTNLRSKSPTPSPATFPSAHFCAPAPLPFPMPFWGGAGLGTPAVGTANAALQI